MPLGLQAVDPTLALEFLIRDELFEELCELALGFVVWWHQNNSYVVSMVHWLALLGPSIAPHVACGM